MRNVFEIIKNTHMTHRQKKSNNLHFALVVSISSLSLVCFSNNTYFTCIWLINSWIIKQTMRTNKKNEFEKFYEKGEREKKTWATREQKSSKFFIGLWKWNIYIACQNRIYFMRAMRQRSSMCISFFLYSVFSGHVCYV